jgi:hypothetical protein
MKNYIKVGKMRLLGLLHNQQIFVRMMLDFYLPGKIDMKKSIIVLAIASSIGLLVSQNVFAGNRPGAITFTPGAAYAFLADKRNISNTWLIPTLAIAYNFDERWAIEGTYGAFNAGKNNGVTGNVDGNLYTVDGLYRFGQYGMLEPYVSAGLGVFRINPNDPDAVNQANINAGLGAQMFFHDSVALRGEVRDLYTMSGGQNDVTVGLGVSFLFGGSTPASAPLSKDVAYKDVK